MQSGDDEILTAMKRDYDRIYLFDLINKLHRSVKNITIGADVIVGFPGESELNFKNSYDLVEQSNIHHLHVFPFSSRPDTVAETMSDQIPSAVKNKRARVLRDLGDKNKLNHITNFIDKRLSVLFEKRKSTDNKKITGLSDNYLRINAFGNESQQGEILEVLIKSIDKNSAFGEIQLGFN